MTFARKRIVLSEPIWTSSTFETVSTRRFFSLIAELRLSRRSLV